MSSEKNLRHIAIIMDGNNRWAKKRGLLNINGHKAGVERIRDMLNTCRDNSVEALTLFAFSSENWNRPKREVDALMRLFHNYLTNESPQLRDEGVRLRVIGGRDRFSDKVLGAIENAEDITLNGSTDLVIAADYGGKWDITRAAKNIAIEVAAGRLLEDDISEEVMDKHMSTADLPPLDLLIRTGGEQRISNFLMWQAAYAELYFSSKLWPDFSSADLLVAIDEFNRRQRRFGLTGDQIAGSSKA
ncbi:polyprenyl diphosphate synthase [Aurantivibrio plasticivorans]